MSGSVGRGKQKGKRRGGRPKPPRGLKQEGVGGEKPSPRGQAAQSWFADKRPILQFVLLFGVAIIAFNAYFSVSFSQGSLFSKYLNLNAEASAIILRFFGDPMTVNGKLVSSPRFSFSIESGCDAIQASAFFVFAVLASPVPVSRLARIRPVVIGTLILLTLNLVRIVSLFYAGTYSQQLFELMHAEIWQAGFIFLPISFWLLWVRLVMRRAERKTHVST